MYSFLPFSLHHSCHLSCILICQKSCILIYRSHVDFVFEKEQLIGLKKTNGNEANLRNMMARYYEKQSALDEPLRKISNIPFNLIISLMPDKRLTNIFEEQNLKHSYNYFKTDGIREDFTEIPTKDDPLIYHLLGSFAKRQAIVTFDNMFKFLSSIMTNDLPVAIKNCLLQAGAIIFLGVHFEWWHTQLILRKAMAPPGGGNLMSQELSYALSSKADVDNATFIMDRLGISFIGKSPETFLDQLYNSCESKGLLKSSPKQQIKERVVIFFDEADSDAAESVTNISNLMNIEIIAERLDNRTKSNKNRIWKERDADVVICMISEKSLFNNLFVIAIKEIQAANKVVIPCLIGKVIFDDKLESRKTICVNTEKRIIDDKILNSSGMDTTSLENQKNKWNEYDAVFSETVKKLKQYEYAHFYPNEISKSISRISEIIKSTKSTWKKSTIV